MYCTMFQQSVYLLANTYKIKRIHAHKVETGIKTIERLFHVADSSIYHVSGKAKDKLRARKHAFTYITALSKPVASEIHTRNPLVSVPWQQQMQQTS